MKEKDEKIPFHTRFGLRLLQVLLVIFSLLLVKRCVDIYQDNRLTDAQLKIEYFDKGYATGMKRAKGLSGEPKPQFKNYALKKACRDGYRQGWDKAYEEIGK